VRCELDGGRTMFYIRAVSLLSRRRSVADEEAMAGEYNFRPVWPRLPEPVVFDPLLETNDSTSAFSR
jgi:hypothetical protein